MVDRQPELTAVAWGARIAAVKPLFVACDTDELLVAVLLTSPEPFAVTMTKNPRPNQLGN